MSCEAPRRLTKALQNNCHPDMRERHTLQMCVYHIVALHLDDPALDINLLLPQQGLIVLCT